MKTDLEKVKRLGKDLRKGYPRSPREKLGGYVSQPAAQISAGRSCWRSTGSTTTGRVH
jgi:hypothetical protein